MIIFLLLLLTGCESNQKLNTINFHPNIPKIEKQSSSEMIDVSGEYCDNVVQSCLKYKDPPNNFIRRCEEFGPSQCTGKKKSLKFSIDREEYGGTIPMVSINWFDAKKLCENDGKRLCSDEEWTLACEGKEMLPYPYGYVRNRGYANLPISEICNIDKTELVKNGQLIDHRATKDKYPNCLSPFGVHNMVGNADEWVINVNGSETQVPYVSGLRGGWWGPLRNRCRAMTTGHNQYYKQEQIGFRCCKD